MTYKQEQQWRKLQAKIKQAYKVFQSNTDKSKHDKLAQAWLNALQREEKFTSKFAD